MDNYDYFAAAGEIEDFVIKDLSNWYMRINRRRFWKTEQSEDKIHGYDTLYEALTTLSGLIAPFTPFISEYFYQKLKRPVSDSMPESIHMDELPKFEEELISTDLENSMVNIKNIVEAGRSARSAGNLKIRQPLSKIVYIGEHIITDEKLQDIIKTELNVKSVEFKKDMEWAKSYNVKLNLKRVGPRFKKELPEILAAMESQSGEKLKSQLENQGKVMIKLKDREIELEKDDIVLEELIPEDYSIGKVADATVLLDTAITPDLKFEATAREVVRRIQVMRKDMDLDYSAEIDVQYSSTDDIQKAVSAFDEYIRNETLAKSLEFVKEIKQESGVEGKTQVSDDNKISSATWPLENAKLILKLQKRG